MIFMGFLLRLITFCVLIYFVIEGSTSALVFILICCFFDSELVKSEMNQLIKTLKGDNTT